MDDWIDIKKDEKHIARERQKAKELRKTKWWQEQLDCGICHYCGEKFSPEELTMDHLVRLPAAAKAPAATLSPAAKNVTTKRST